MRVASSAPSRPSNDEKAAIIAASGASISRDQCETSGSGAPMRGSVVSNQGAPASSSRTEMSRTASSGSPSQSESDGPGPDSVATTRTAVASKAQASGVAADRPSMGNRDSKTCCETSIDIAAASRNWRP